MQDLLAHVFALSHFSPSSSRGGFTHLDLSKVVNLVNCLLFGCEISQGFHTYYLDLIAVKDVENLCLLFFL